MRKKRKKPVQRYFDYSLLFVTIFLVGYIMSGDPTYITSHNNARSMIMKVERDELIEEALHYYINNKLK